MQVQRWEILVFLRVVSWNRGKRRMHGTGRRVRFRVEMRKLAVENEEAEEEEDVVDFLGA
jgi:hypothetical protein